MRIVKKFRTLLVMLMLLVSAMAITSCEIDIANTKNLVSVDVIDVPEDGIYAGAFDEANIKVLLTYEDGSTETVRLLERDLPEEYKTLLTIPGEHTVEMLYRGFEITYTVTVKASECTVTFVNAEDEIVKTVTYNFIEKTPEIVPPTAEEMYVEGYRFTGEFDKSFEDITEDTVIKGIYIKSSTVRFYNVLGELVNQQSVDLGATAIAPSEEEMAVDGYRFTGEFDKSLENITEDTDITGLYVKTHVVTFYNALNEIVATQLVDEGGTAIAPSAEDMAVEGYRFTGEFDKSLENITEDTDITGLYVKTYVVTFYNAIGEIVSVQNVDEGGTATAPSAEDMAVEGYRFTGEFDKSLENITEDTDITGLYVKTYVVTFFNGRNQVISTQIVDEGADAVEPTAEERSMVGYIWNRWDRPFTNVQHNLTVYGVYIKGYTLHYSSNNEDAGTVRGNFEIGASVPIASRVSLVAEVTDPNYIFTGWYADNTLVCSDANYDFVMLSKSIVLVAKFEHMCESGHDNVSYDAKAPTCTEIGWDAYTICRRCGENTYVEKEALGHNAEWIVETEPTCTTAGVRAYKCDRCGLEFERESLDPLGHDMSGNECTRCHEHMFTVSIEYVYANGSTAAPAVTVEVWENTAYSIPSPELEGYRADSAFIGGIATADATYTVTYTAIELEKITRIKPINLGSVEYNTSFSALGLPSTVVAITNTARELTLPVYWNEETYSKNTYGDQRITGTVVAGYGYVLACDNLAIATVNVSQNIITQINPMNLGRLPLGTSYAGLGLPSTAGVTTSAGAVYYLPVTWNVYEYDSSVEGEHTITGTVTLLEGFTLASGVSDTATVTFTLSDAMYGTADIIFIVDTTGSMYNEIQNVRRNINAFAERLEREGVSVRWALLEYRDITCDGIDSTKVIYCGSSEWFIDVTSYERAIAALDVNGGGDGPETVIDALMAATLLESREDAKTFHIVVTDADYKTNNQYGISGMSEMIEELLAKDITASVVTKTSYYDVYRNLTDATNGILANIDGNFADELWRLCDLIIDDVIYGNVASIEIIKSPDKTAYESGDYFNGSGMIVEATYENGRKRIITVYSVMPCRALQTTDHQIEVNYRGKVAYIPITVVDTIVPVTGIELSDAEVTLEVDDSITVTATVVPFNATNKNVVWSTANANVATVSNGNITAVGVGTTTITVSTLDGLHSASVTVTVNAKNVAVENVVTSIGAIQLTPDSTYTVVATVYPLNATNKNLIWSSSNPEVASVLDGVISAHTEGNATITVTTVDGGHTAKIYVVVKLETCALSGRVLNASGNGLSGVTVKAYRFGTLVAETTTTSSGNYSFAALVYGDYEFVYEKSTYISSNYTAVINSAAYTVENITLVTDGEYYGNVAGYVTDATTTSPITGITVNVREGSNNTTGSIVATLTTDAYGYYCTSELLNGYYTFEFVDERGYRVSYTSVSYNVSVAGNSTATCNASLSGGIDFSSMRVVLRWGSKPSDLDSHMHITNNGSSYHVYYGNKTPSGAKANLDVDDTTYYGPETTTVVEFFERGIYTYSVHDYSNKYNSTNTVLSNSGASVEVYFGDTLYGTYNVPAGAGTCWNVFTYNAYTGEFIVNNTITYISDWQR